MEPVLSAANLSIGYKQARQPDHVVAPGVSVSLHPGELVCLLGPNGVGKSTLLRTLAAMQPALGGHVTLNVVHRVEHKPASGHQIFKSTPNLSTHIRWSTIRQHTLGIHATAPKNKVLSKLPFELGTIHSDGADLHRIEDV